MANINDKQAKAILSFNNFFFLAISCLPILRTVIIFAMQNIITIMEIPKTIVSFGVILITSSLLIFMHYPFYAETF